MAEEFTIPKQIITGDGALELSAGILGRLGKKALIVTDQAMLELGNCFRVERLLKQQGTAYSVYAGITGEPTDKMVSAGLEQYKKESCDFLIAVGGGSPIDSMKAIGCLAAYERRISDYMGVLIDVKTPPMAAIPTTAGTGSEATRFTIITDTEKNIKMLLKGNCLIPELSIVDPQFTVTVPPAVTAATGLDALCHAVEAYTSRKAQPLSDTFALSAVKKIFRSLPAAYQNGADRTARAEMALASLEAGIAFNNASVTLIHGMSRPIGALFHIPHGLSNAVLLNVCLAYAIPAARGRFAVLAKTAGAAAPEDPDETAAEKFIGAVKALTSRLQVPTLEELKISRKEFMEVLDKMVSDAMESGSPQNTLRETSAEQIRKLYLSLWPPLSRTI